MGGLCSISSTLCVIGGLMWTALQLKIFILLMMRLLQNERQTLLMKVVTPSMVDRDKVKVVKEGVVLAAEHLVLLPGALMLLLLAPMLHQVNLTLEDLALEMDTLSQLDLVLHWDIIQETQEVLTLKLY